MQLRNRSLSNGPASGSFLIAVDLDDVLFATNESAAAWHNAEYGTDMKLTDFHYYHWWRNKYWGSPEKTIRKVQKYYASPYWTDLPPIKDAYKCLKKLQGLGCTFVVLTSRPNEQREMTAALVEKHFPGIFREVDHMMAPNVRDPNIYRPTKRDRLPQLGARMLIDDNLDCCIDTSYAGIPTLLFGNYEWNKRRTKEDEDRMTYEDKVAQEGPLRKWWQDDDFPEHLIPSTLKRVYNWRDVVAAVEEQMKRGSFSK